VKSLNIQYAKKPNIFNVIISHSAK